MYFLQTKASFRGLGGLISIFIGIMCTLAAFFMTIVQVVFLYFGTFSRPLAYLNLLLWLEGLLTLMTFSSGTCDGPNSALWNLPLFATDLVVVVLVCTLLGPLDEMAPPGTIIDTTTWKYNGVDVIRTIIFLIAIIRYTGLAWTDQKFFLKRLVAPIRREQVKESASFNFGQVQDPMAPI